MNKEELKKIIVEEIKTKAYRTMKELDSYTKEPIKEIYFFETMDIKELESLVNNIISKIPEPILTEADIVEVLTQYQADRGELEFLAQDKKWSRGKFYKEAEKLKHEIASHILQDKGWKVVGTNQPFCRNYCGDTLYEVDKNHVLDMAIRIREIKQK